MNKIFGFILTATALFGLQQAGAQSYAEMAHTFGRTNPPGSARVLGVGGAATALGGDYSAALTNPAGLGMYNRSEFTFTPGFTTTKINSAYFGNNQSETKNVINVPGLSAVFHLPKENGSFLGGSFAITFSRVNDFNRSIRYGGSNQNNSIVDYFIDDAFGTDDSQFDPETGFNFNTPTGLAYDNFLIAPKSILNPPGSPTEYFTDATYPYLQQEEIETKGASNQWSLSYGANIGDILFVGGGLGIRTIRYESQKTFSEFFDSDTLENIILNENLSIRGTGVNLTVGAIVRPVDFLQLGLSYSTPTLYGLTETYDASMSAKWLNFDYFGDGSKILGDNTNDPLTTDVITSDYNLSTPSRLSAGATFISKFGFLTGDIEVMNYGAAKYSSNTPGITYGDENDEIRSIYRRGINYRLGAEGRYKMYRVRAGYGVQANTFKGEIKTDNQIVNISGGVGIRTEKFFADLTLIRSTSENLYAPYTFFDGSGPRANQDITTVNAVITLGFTF